MISQAIAFSEIHLTTVCKMCNNVLKEMNKYSYDYLGGFSMTKRIISIIITVAMILSLFPLSQALATGTIPAYKEITVLLDKTELTFDVPPQKINGRTMVPLRKIFESLGAEVTWDNDHQDNHWQKRCNHDCTDCRKHRGDSKRRGKNA